MINNIGNYNECTVTASVSRVRADAQDSKRLEERTAQVIES